MREKKEVTEAQRLRGEARMMEVMTDGTRTVRLGGKEYEIRALRPGTQWLIAKEAAEIAVAEGEGGVAFGDVIRGLAGNIPSVVRCLALAILNDKGKIEGKEYGALYDELMWETEPGEWIGVLGEVLQMTEVEFFFACTRMMQMTRSGLEMRKRKAGEAM